jgi:hypothetical protein
VSDPLHNVTESAWNWTPQREKAALAVAESATIVEAAGVAGVTRKTIHEWLKAPEFKARVDEYLEEVVSAARSIMRRNATAAAKTVVDLSVWGLPGHTTRLAAAKDVLDRVGLKPVQEVKQENSGAVTVRWEYGDDSSGE